MLRSGGCLYVKPIRWTTRHLQLLDCQFVEVPPPEGKQDPAVRFSDNVIAMVKHLSTSVSPFDLEEEVEHKSLLVGDILTSIHPIHRLFRYCAAFSFGKNEFFDLKTNGFFATSRYMEPDLAYINFNTIGKYRKESVHYPSHRKTPYNLICDRLYQIKLRKSIPENKTEDPYIAALLIALAQRRYNRNKYVAASEARREMIRRKAGTLSSQAPSAVAPPAKDIKVRAA
ncbi:hypothetical protein B0T25DRAFT_264947 [Lasiosphaeria hispida]|uniref:Uncharacterized protein n=1 Tax=Lasiosphaeria hispida TaxID=260671 RepID=A0AAJ0HAM5_9PEZI|nr:hypothetical protein B0T25DRAFT_264947 [Lasiosphaeria hispida]